MKNKKENLVKEVKQITTDDIGYIEQSTDEYFSKLFEKRMDDILKIAKVHTLIKCCETSLVPFTIEDYVKEGFISQEDVDFYYKEKKQ